MRRTAIPSASSTSSARARTRPRGAALAIAILSFLKNIGARTVATTHYSELKVYALTTKGVENASCEFDVATLRPTYRLLIGIPGKSNAFAISQKLGLPNYIIEDAKNHIEQNDAAFEDLLSRLEADRRTMEAERREILAYRTEIEDLKARHEKADQNLDERKERILEKARAEAERILSEAKESADQSIRRIKPPECGLRPAPRAREREKRSPRQVKVGRKDRTEEEGRKGGKARGASHRRLGPRAQHGSRGHRLNPAG